MTNMKPEEPTLEERHANMVQALCKPGEALVEEIKSSGVITLPQFRILTGACQAGCKRFLYDKGIPPETEPLPIVDVIEMTKDAFGGEVLRGLFSA